jgi:cytochrome b involved in lipid metabolism
MLKKIVFSFLSLSFVFILSACGNQVKAPVDNLEGKVSQAKIDAVNNQRATLTPEEEAILKEQAYQEQAETYHWITADEVAKHNSRTDCWLIIHDRVYDVTKYISSHPGGPIIISSCGKDATEMFDNKPGDGSGHSEKAQDMLGNFYIGDKDLEK